MARLRTATVPPLGLGLIGLVLGMIGLLLVFLPILAVPLGVLGLLAAVLGLATASVRWSLAGVVVSCLTVILGLVIAAVPVSSGMPQGGPPSASTITLRPYVAPPARPDWWRASVASAGGEPAGEAANSR